MQNATIEKLTKATRLIQEALSELSGEVSVPVRAKGATQQNTNSQARNSLDYSINPRAFFKIHAGKKSGPQKAVLVIAYAGKGSTEAVVTKADIQKLWSGAEGLLGTRQTMFFTRARENGWIDAPKDGEYVLTKNWKAAI